MQFREYPSTEYVRTGEFCIIRLKVVASYMRPSELLKPQLSNGGKYSLWRSLCKPNQMPFLLLVAVVDRIGYNSKAPIQLYSFRSKYKKIRRITVVCLCIPRLFIKVFSFFFFGSEKQEIRKYNSL